MSKKSPEMKFVHDPIVELMQDLKVQGAKISWRKNSMYMGMGAAGASDLSIVVEGVPIACECKYRMRGKRGTVLESKKPTHLQWDYLHAHHQSGGVSVVVDMESVGVFKDYLRGMATGRQPKYEFDYVLHYEQYKPAIDEVTLDA